VTGWTGVALDIHDLRAAQLEASLAAERLRVTYETAPAGLCLYDRELRFLSVNERLAVANGQPADAHLGRSLAEMAPHVADILTPVLRQVLATGQPREDIEVRAPDPNAPGGERVWLANYHPVRDAQGAVEAIAGAVLDITARKHAEDAQHLLSREVDHRAKNVLAVVRSLVRLRRPRRRTTWTPWWKCWRAASPPWRACTPCWRAKAGWARICARSSSRSWTPMPAASSSRARPCA
jgi:PAS domain S-box-containing protein